MALMANEDNKLSLYSDMLNVYNWFSKNVMKPQVYEKFHTFNGKEVIDECVRLINGTIDIDTRLVVKGKPIIIRFPISKLTAIDETYMDKYFFKNKNIPKVLRDNILGIEENDNDNAHFRIRYHRLHIHHVHDFNKVNKK